LALALITHYEDTP